MSTENLWSDLYKREIVGERVVAGLHAIEALERVSAYQPKIKGFDASQDSYFVRVKNALRHLPAEKCDPALAVYANAIYIPDRIMSSTHAYLWRCVRERWAMEHAADSSLLSNDIHLFSVDEPKLIKNFCLQNDITGRLNDNKFPRINSVTAAREHLDRIRTASDDAEIEDVARKLEAVARKKLWLVLSDKVMSGQSLVGDLRRIGKFRSILHEWSGMSPTIYIGAQVSTCKAEKSLESLDDDMIYYSAIRFDERSMVNCDECELFSSESIRRDVLDLCEWFDEAYLSKDEKLATIRSKSQDGSLSFGYNATGITFVDSENAPSNSLPILWHSQPGGYMGPFVRIHSREGEEAATSTEAEGWNRVDSARTEILARLQRVNI